MGLFSRAHCSVDEAERILGRPVNGTPTDGELAILFSLNRDHFREVRQALDGDGLDAEFRSLIQERIQLGVARGQAHVTHRVRIPARVAEHFERVASRLNVGLAECLEGAILRDFNAQETSTQAIDRLTEAVGTYHRAVDKLSAQLAQTLDRAGNIADITMRLGRLEAMLQIIVNAIQRR